jgi:signal transduction histidine kinase
VELVLGAREGHVPHAVAPVIPQVVSVAHPLALVDKVGVGGGEVKHHHNGALQALGRVAGRDNDLVAVVHLGELVSAHRHGQALFAEAIEQGDRPLAQRKVELQIVPKIIEAQQVVEFSVTDSGVGMSPEVMSRVFEAFYTTKKEGMGIGLNLCRTIIESHQGRMQAENIYNGKVIMGCRFSFWLPASPSLVSS